MKETLNQSSDPASAVVSINPQNGAIRAMTAVVPGKKNIQFNLAAQGRRQSGSAFKTFVLTEAIRQGINPYSTQYSSSPFHWQPDPNSEPWDVATYSHSYIGAVPISTATLSSDNTVYARLTLDVGPENVVRSAKQMGIKTELLPVASIGLGSNAVSVLEMASAYATLAAGGVLLRADGDPQGRARRRQRGQATPAGAAQAKASHVGRRRLRGDADPPGQHHRRDGHRRRTTATRPRPGRPGRPTTRRTPGSPAIRRGRPPSSGSAIRTPRSPWRASTGSRVRRFVPGVDLEALHVARARAARRS